MIIYLKPMAILFPTGFDLKLTFRLRSELEDSGLSFLAAAGHLERCKTCPPLRHFHERLIQIREERNEPAFGWFSKAEFFVLKQKFTHFDRYKACRKKPFSLATVSRSQILQIEIEAARNSVVSCCTSG